MLGSVDGKKIHLNCDKLSHHSMLETLADLYIDNVHFDPQDMPLTGSLVQLPGYPFDKKSHWFAQYPEEVMLTVNGDRSARRG